MGKVFNKYFLTIISLLIFSFLISPLSGFCDENEKIEPVDIQGDQIDYLHEEGKIKASGNVRMKYKGVVLVCDEAVYDSKTNIANVRGNVKIEREEGTIYGDDISYNFNTNTVEMVDMKIEAPPVYGSAENIKKEGDEKFSLEHGQITTCDLEKPHYRLVARHITVYPGDRVIARNVVFKVGNVPIFFFPYFNLSLKDQSFPLQIVPGKDGDWGYYVLTRWRYSTASHKHRGSIISDWYEKRGWGRGIHHKSETTNLGETLFKGYYIDDKLYSLEKRDDLFDKYPERRNLAAKYLDDDRYRIQFAHSWQPMKNLSIKSEVHRWSDQNIIKDFFEREFDIEPHPLSYNLVDYSFPNSSLSLFTQKRMNPFFTETEYLPQLEYDFYRQELGDSDFYLESDTKVGRVTYRVSDSGDDPEGTPDFGRDGRAFRFHSHNVLSYSRSVKWLYFNPYVGYYTTFYSDNIFGEKDEWNIAPEAGINLSTKLFKSYDTDFLIFGEEIDKIRHIITPTIGYEYIHAPTISKDHLYPFDDIEDLEREEKVTFTFENKWQARNENRTWDFVYFRPSVEYQLNKPGKGSYFDKIKADVEFYPKRGLSLNGDVEYDVVDRAWKEANVDLSFGNIKEDNYSVSFGHRYLRGDSSQSTFDFRYQLTPKLQFRNYLRYEYKTGKFQEQQYALRQDLHCWWLDLGLDIDKDTNYTFWVKFTLKAFPDARVGFDHTYDGAKSEY